MNKVASFKPPYADVPGIDTYFGGKGGSGVYQAIINQIPPHNSSVSGFLGHCAILRMKRPARLNIGIDISSRVVAAWQRAILHGPMKHLEVLEGDFLSINPNIWNTESTFLYLDPPYPMEVRKSPRDRYDYELSYMEHELLLHNILAAKCKIAISSYPNALYDDRLKGWRYIDFSAQTRSGIAMERLYMNYDEPEELHDYNYLGESYKHRERIKLKFQRWVANFEGLPVLE